MAFFPIEEDMHVANITQHCNGLVQILGLLLGN